MRYPKMKWLAPIVGAAVLVLASTAMAADVELSFYYPVAVGGPITKIIDGYAADFEKENPSIKVKAIYAGTYQDTLVKALTAFKSGEPPDIAVLLSTDMFTLIDEDAVMPFDGLLKSEADKSWAKGFYPAFMENSQTGGKTWGIPFQRSTIVMYWNKDAFKAAGLNPDKAPDTWDELVADGRKLTINEGDRDCVRKLAGAIAAAYGLDVREEGAPTGRRRPYAMTPAMPAIATRKDITNATTRAGATSLALGPSARHRRRTSAS